MSDTSDEAREAALLALATKFALIESPVNLIVDAVLDAGGPFLVAAACAEIKQELEESEDRADAYLHEVNRLRGVVSELQERVGHGS